MIHDPDQLAGVLARVVGPDAPGLLDAGLLWNLYAENEISAGANTARRSPLVPSAPGVPARIESLQLAVDHERLADDHLLPNVLDAVAVHCPRLESLALAMPDPPASQKRLRLPHEPEPEPEPPYTLRPVLVRGCLDAVAPGLRELVLRKVVHTAEDAACVAQMLPKAQGLKRLELSHCRGNGAFAAVLGLPAGSLPGLEELDLSFNEPEPEALAARFGYRHLRPPGDMTERAMALGRIGDVCPGLVHLDFKGNDLGSLEGALPGLAGLTRLDISWCRLLFPDAHVGPGFAAGIRNLTVLASLGVSNNRLFTESKFPHVGELPPTVEHLDLSHNGSRNRCRSRSDEDTALADTALALRRIGPNLTSLSLRGGYVGADGAVLLAPALRAMTRLTALDLARNRLFEEEEEEEEDGVFSPPYADLVSALGGLVRLRALDLGGNNARPDVAAPALAALTSLTSLRLADNDMGSFQPGLGALARVLRTLERLVVLDVGENRLCASGVDALVPAVDALSRLRLADLTILHGNGREWNEDVDLRSVPSLGDAVGRIVGEVR